MSIPQSDTIEIKLFYRPATEFDDAGNVFSLAARWELFVLDTVMWTEVLSQNKWGTRVLYDLTEFGYLKAWVVPTRSYNNITIVECNYLEYGWAKASSLSYEYIQGLRAPFLFGQCKLCVWATGEACLPCTVNPLGFAKEECRDFERTAT